MGFPMRIASLAALTLTLGCLTFLACSSEDPPVVVAPPVPEAGTGQDASTACEKHCDGVCVAATAPITGCAGTSCAPCPSSPHRPAVCNTQQACAAGSCDPGYLDCDDAVQGCETNGQTDPKNCGLCNVFCASSATCVAGNCQP